MFNAPPLGRWLVSAVCLVALWAGSAWALGTSAGTTIANTATVTYTVVSNPTPLTASASHSFEVLEIIDVIATWQDAAEVAVNSPDSDRVLTFLATNTGNGPEDIRLLTNGILGGDDFDPGVQTLWLDSNGTVGLQTSGATPDTLYIVGAGVPLTADENITIYLLSNIPGSRTDGEIGNVQLVAEAMTIGAAGAATGTELPGAGYNGVDAIVGTTEADGDAVGGYEVTTVGVAPNKSIQQIVDLLGGNQPYPGAVVTYRILVNITGSGTAEALVITDTIPADMTYTAGSMVLDGTPQTDADDPPTDNSDFNVTNANAVTIDLGDTVAPATRTIEFDATIN